jgi:Arc/MetJ family transcription regulator
MMCYDAAMRTTVSLDEDLAARLRQMAKERDISFKEALNTTLRAGLGSQGGRARPYRVRPRRMGLRPGVDLDRALRLASALEDEETVRKLELRK